MALYSTARIHPPLPSLNIPDTIDFHQKHNATLPMYVYVGMEQNAELKEITYLEFGRAIHRVASVITPTIPPGRQVIGLMALTDSLLYQSIAIGIMKAGFIPFPISPRNTPAAVINLLKKSSCHHIFSTQTTLQVLLHSIRRELESEDPVYELNVYEIPSLHVVFPKLAQEHEEDPFTPFTSSIQPALTDIAMYLHSSGSTGFPKAIPQTHQIFTHWAAFPPNDFFKDHKPHVRVAGMHLPPFHTLGLYCQVIFPVYATATVSLYPPVTTSPHMLPVTPSPDNILSHVERTKSNAIITIPALLQIWGQSSQSVDILSKLEMVAYSGGAVSPKLGDYMVSSGVKLSPNYGGTEFASVTYLAKRKGDEKDWMYMEFSPRCHLRWIPQGDGTYECQFLTNENHKLPVENLADVPGYATADLFEPHPTKEYLWKIVGRIDDVIIHSSGEKTVPSPMEDVVLSSTHLMGAVMFGRNHDQPGILVEPKPPYAIDIEDEKQVVEFRNLIWPVIEEANGVAPSFSRIFKEMVIVTHKNKPLPRAGKGTVMRKLALQQYDTEIEALYSTVEAAQPSEFIQPPITWTKEHVSHWLSEQVKDLNKGNNIPPFSDLFENGFDSLSATILRRRISGVIQTLQGSSRERALQAVTQNTIYNHPKIDLLAEHISFLVTGESNSRPKILDRIEQIEEMIRKYSFNEGLPNLGQKAPTPSVVLLTGSTGSIGSQLLEGLIRDSRIKRIYTLNRPSKQPNSPSVYDRQLEKFRDKGLDATLLDVGKVTFWESELSNSGLGLNKATYEEIHESVDTIIHTAWRLDFNLSLASFETNIIGMRNLVEFARSFPNAVRFIFTSSIASVGSWDIDANGSQVPESVIENAKYAVGNGYGESKYVAERILASSGLSYATSLRIGQVCGSLPNGSWSPTDWLPILVKSSIELGALPLANGVVSWIPINTVSQSILDVAFSPLDSIPTLNMRHPKPTEWNTIMDHMADALQNVAEDGERQPKRQKTESAGKAAEDRLKFIPFHEWVDKLEMYMKVNQDTEKVPARNLLDFFKRASEGDRTLSPGTVKEAGGLPKFSISKMQSISSSLREQPALEYADVERWIGYWRKVGYME